jgi:hypothetical protein
VTDFDTEVGRGMGRGVRSTEPGGGRRGGAQRRVAGDNTGGAWAVLLQG